MANFFKKLDRITVPIQEWIMIITCIIVTAIIMAGALGRYIFKIDFFGSEELTLFFAFWLYFIGSMYAARNNSHINANMISMFTDNKKVINTFELFKDIISLLMAIVATVWSYNYVSFSITMNARSSVFKIPNVIAQLPILISFFAWIFYAIRDLIKTINSFKRIEGGGLQE